MSSPSASQPDGALLSALQLEQLLAECLGLVAAEVLRSPTFPVADHIDESGVHWWAESSVVGWLSAWLYWQRFMNGASALRLAMRAAKLSSAAAIADRRRSDIFEQRWQQLMAGPILTIDPLRS